MCWHIDNNWILVWQGWYTCKAHLGKVALLSYVSFIPQGLHAVNHAHHESINSYHSVYKHKHALMSHFSYHCSQINTWQHKPRKGQCEGALEHDKDQMDTFECDKWLHITLMDLDNNSMALVKFKHKDEHIPYWYIDVPPNIQKYIWQNTSLSPTKVSDLNIDADLGCAHDHWLSFGQKYWELTQSQGLIGKPYIKYGLMKPAKNGSIMLMRWSQHKFWSLKLHYQRQT